jgi:uncharacterized SAM-binding protein YcdF (DUF218 family)
MMEATRHTDAIVIFGAAVKPDGAPSTTLRRRVEAAVAFGAGLANPLYVPTGGVGRFGPAESEVMAGLLAAFGVPPERILVEPTGTDTLSSVRAVRQRLRGRGFSRVFAASSRYHLPRCVALLWLAGLPARACPPPGGPSATDICTRWYWRLREIPALPLDVVLLLALRLRGRL